MQLRAIIPDRRGGAAVEFALCVPILSAILFGSIELGSYFYNEHILVKAVRDGARFAARQDISTYSAKCGSTTASDLGTIYTNTRTIVQKGVLSGGAERMPGWTDDGFSMSVDCTKMAGSTTLGGFYGNVKDTAGNVVGAPRVTVAATVNYPTIFATLGLAGGSYSLKAQQQAAVIGW
ncbi:pilus assembly protein [Sphingomonas sp. BN140010]|uniref:Pilus assembly protein n=1 Tax=Sphingomonas arvum TaxID=2992113 RepID=A0ABT3JDN3_9SPHN|nr:TadE/TadG family type IV pilus assembly protein [Sphingomonas sp. BN140010]MCW3797178.1 pilus assembly protein [Sphingomonas sp. BN140010]